jgi:hypothetical protein
MSSYHQGGVNGPQAAYKGLVWAFLSVGPLDPEPPFRMLVRCELLADPYLIEADVPMTDFGNGSHRAQWTIPPEVFATGAYISYELVDVGEWTGNRSRMGYGYVPPAGKTQADIDAAVVAATTPLNANILTLQTEKSNLQGSNMMLTVVNSGQVAQIASLEATRLTLQERVTELEATATVVGFVPALRTGQYTIKDFSVFNGIQRTPSGNFYKYDIDFINVQLLSMKQGALKMRRIAAVADSAFGMQFRTQWARDTEFNAKKAAGFNDCLLESARIIEFAVNEIRNNQRFDLANVEYNRTI